MGNPVIIIVGAGPGVGAATARRFAAAGYDIGLIARNPERLKALAESLSKGGAQVGWASAEVSDEAALGDVLRRMTKQTGRLDVLLYNAVSYRAAPATELSAQDLLTDLAIGTTSLLTAVHAVLPVLREQHTGTIIATGSAVADNPNPAAASLGVQKAALRNLVQALSCELTPEGIHVATVTIYGAIAEGTPFAPSAIAEIFAGLAEETGTDPANWRTVVELRGATAQSDQ
jgi:NADP-dependent 3-hydroxy acid dehydrogenase YdfG